MPHAERIYARLVSVETKIKLDNKCGNGKYFKLGMMIYDSMTYSASDCF